MASTKSLKSQVETDFNKSDTSITDEKIRLLLLIHIKETYGSQLAAADHWGVTAAHVSNMVTGKKRITQDVLDEMGYEKEVSKLVSY